MTRRWASLLPSKFHPLPAMAQSAWEEELWLFPNSSWWSQFWWFWWFWCAQHLALSKHFQQPRLNRSAATVVMPANKAMWDSTWPAPAAGCWLLPFFTPFSFLEKCGVKNGYSHSRQNNMFLMVKLSKPWDFWGIPQLKPLIWFRIPNLFCWRKLTNFGASEGSSMDHATYLAVNIIPIWRSKIDRPKWSKWIKMDGSTWPTIGLRKLTAWSTNYQTLTNLLKNYQFT